MKLALALAVLVAVVAASKSPGNTTKHHHAPKIDWHTAECALLSGTADTNCSHCWKNNNSCFWSPSLKQCASGAERLAFVLANGTADWCQGSACKYVCAGKPCSKQIWPCSETVVGELILMAFYGVLLSFGAKMISDGSELLLEILDPGLIGGLLLPILGAVPDSAIVVMSGAISAADVAQEQIAVGVGTLAGSTIMLLTLPWAVGLWLGRCDIRHGEAVDGRLTKSFDLLRTGVTVDDDTPINARVMIVTSFAYWIVQIVAFVYLADPSGRSAHRIEKWFALAGFVVCTIGLVAYCVWQVLNPSLQRKRITAARHRYMKDVFVRSLLALQTASRDQAGAAERGESEPLLAGSGASASIDGLVDSAPVVADVRAVGLKWKKKAAEKAGSIQDAAEPGRPATVRPVTSIAGEAAHEAAEEGEHPANWMVIVPQALAFLSLGTGLVTVFSDPMVGVISDFGKTIGVPAFFVSFLVTPFCSNASEVISSLIFLAKKKKENASLSYAQLYGAATMNNTMVLGIFYALIFFRGLVWEYSAETMAIIAVTLAVGLIASFTRTYPLFLGFVVLSFYPLSLVLVWVLEYPIGWT